MNTRNNLPIVALVGEPNSGKSTLLNKIVGRRVAVTSNVAGTTRDRQYADTIWSGKHFTLVDTAGMTLLGDYKQELESALNEQIEIAISEADAVVLVVDGKLEPDSINQAALRKFRSVKKPVMVAVNKLDSPRNLEELSASFLKLGIKSVFPVSAVTGRGIGDLLDQVISSLPQTSSLQKDGENPEDGDIEETEREFYHNAIHVSIVGKPNVGKSSLFNSILNEKRVVVSPIAGTTRTSIDTQTVIDGQNYNFIDTAGLKRKDHRQKQPDVFSGFQTFKSIRRSDIALLVLDATEPITKQDQAIAGEIIEMGKGLIIVVNKMDKFDGEEKNLRDYISGFFPFLWFCPMYFVSAENNEGISDCVSAIKPIYINRTKTATEADLDMVLKKMIKKSPPRKMLDQKEPKIYGLNQIAANPPMFELIVNFPAAISQQFKRALSKKIVTELDFWGTPIKLVPRKKN